MIRNILIRTVLPIRKKRTEFLSKFHFSIGYRIGLHYFKLLLLYGILFFAVLLIAYCTINYQTKQQLGQELVSKLQSGQIVLKKNEIKEQSRQLLHTYENQGISIQVKDRSTNQVIYHNIVDSVEEDKEWINCFSYHYKNNKKVIFKDFLTYTREESQYEVYLQYDITKDFQVFQSYFMVAIVCYLFFILLIVKHGKRGILRLLKPIEIMSESANRLTVNNLGSQRLNVEGTKNELKDLAGTINQMLDRIELSYESQKQFVSDASHELRTPIAVIQGYINMLDRWGSKDEEILEESIAAIKNEAVSMQDLVEKLLFLSRHDKKTLKLKKITFNMKLVVEEMIKETKLVTKDRKIVCPKLQDIMVYGDKQALKQAIRIFIDNAIKYSNTGDEIRISCENKKGHCVVTVEDTGIGMKREDMDNIFERFYRSDEVRNHKINGHGLGLSIAKLIVLKHVGSIRVRSQYEKGSSFKITLPNYPHIH